jgi:transposase
MVAGLVINGGENCRYLGQPTLWLRGALGLKSDQVAMALDWNAAAVRRLQALYFREGESALLRPGRGGRRHAGLSREQEQALLTRLAQESNPNSVIEARQVQEALERIVGHPVTASAVYRLMARHSWRRAASGQALIPGGATRKLADREASGESAGQEPKTPPKWSR